MTGEDAAAAVSAGTAAPQKRPKDEGQSDDEDDKVPLALPRGKKKASDANASKAKKVKDEEVDDDQDNMPLSHSRAKRASNGGASKVKEEDSDDDGDDDFMPSSGSRAKKGNEKQKSSAKTKGKASKVKKEEIHSDDESKPKKKAAMSNSKTPKKNVKDEDVQNDIKEEKKVGVKKKDGTVAIVKRERKVYELPGQKHDPPAERDPLRIFYESLYNQVPTSEMAAIWLMEWGLLPVDVARKVFEKKQGQKFKSPVKAASIKRNISSPAKKSPLSSAKKTSSAVKDAGKNTKQKKKRQSNDSDDDDDFVDSKPQTKRRKMSS